MRGVTVSLFVWLYYTLWSFWKKGLGWGSVNFASARPSIRQSICLSFYPSISWNVGYAVFGATQNRSKQVLGVKLPLSNRKQLFIGNVPSFILTLSLFASKLHVCLELLVGVFGVSPKSRILSGFICFVLFFSFVLTRWKQGRIHGNPVADGWAGAVMQKPLAN